MCGVGGESGVWRWVAGSSMFSEVVSEDKEMRAKTWRRV